VGFFKESSEFPSLDSLGDDNDLQDENPNESNQVPIHC
jgi:hypothetical protein